MLPIPKPLSINAGKSGEHIAVNKEFTPIPDELLESLEFHGVEVKETITGFRLFDRLMLFSYVVNGPEGEYFLQVVSNYWAKKYWTAYPLWNPRALEYVSRKENFNVIFIYEKDILELGVDFVSKCIYEKINAPPKGTPLLYRLRITKTHQLSRFFTMDCIWES